jgi:long-chain acyl-CoA synthetase
VDYRTFYSRIPDRRYADFKDFLVSAASRGGARLAFRWRPGNDEEEVRLSFAELGDRAAGLASRFLAAGLVRGDRIAVLSENRPEWCVSYLGIVANGFVVVPLDTSLDEGGLERNLKASGCKAICSSSKQIGRHPVLSDPAKRREAGLALVLDFDLPAAVPPAGAAAAAGARDAAPGPGYESWALAASSAADQRLPRPGEIGADADAVVFFTSGTTGLAKGIVLSHRAVLENVNAARMSLIVDESDVFVALLPLHHTYAATCSFLSGVEATCTIAVVDRIAPTAVLRAIKECGVTFVIGVPLLFDKLRSGIEAGIATSPPVLVVYLRVLLAISRFLTVKLGVRVGRGLFGALRRKAGLQSVRLAVSGGGPLSAATADFFDAIGINLVQGYGMSENGPLISVNLPEYKDNRSVGFPVKNTEVRIHAPGPDGVGEIEARSPSLMKGYLAAPEATAEVFTADGWLRTGDLGRIDRRGFLFITGRRKNLIITEGGKNVYPEEIEGHLDESPWLKESIVVGRPAKPGVKGEDVVALVVPDYDAIMAAFGPQEGWTGDRPPEAYVHDLVRSEISRINKILPPYMKIVGFLVRKEEFEKTSSGKIRRFLYSAEAPAIEAQKTGVGWKILSWIPFRSRKTAGADKA